MAMMSAAQRKVQTPVGFEQSQVDRLRSVCQEHGWSLSYAVRRAVDAWLDQIAPAGTAHSSR